MKISANSTRFQLTLFVNEKDSEVFEIIRKKYNPKQFSLIKSHVTLCIEDELKDIDGVLENLYQLKSDPITITFDEIKRFSEGNGVFISAASENKTFDTLRNIVLNNVIKSPQKQKPHITLMHPRNSMCNEGIFEEIKKISFPTQLTFDKISLIEQEIGKKWNILKEFNLTSFNQ